MNQEPTMRELLNIAAQNQAANVLEEPRLYFDELPNVNTTLTQSHPDTFKNNEPFPIRITHLTAAFRFLENSPDARFLQRVGLRLRYHDQRYINTELAPLPLYLNKNVGAGETVSLPTSSWTFDRPSILSARDSLRIQLALESTPVLARLVSVAVTGIGLESKRPYFFEDSLEISDTLIKFLDTSSFRNDGTEPIALVSMTVFCSSESTNVDPQGDIHQLRLNVQQIGNGTNSWWFDGPQNNETNLNNLCPAQLLGVTTGRAIVHRFPDGGFLWEPNDNLLIEAIELVPGFGQAPAPTLVVGLAGYVTVG